MDTTTTVLVLSIGWFLCGWTGYAINLCTYEARAHKDRFWSNGIVGAFGLVYALFVYLKRSLKGRHVAVMYGKPAKGTSYYVR